MTNFSTQDPDAGVKDQENDRVDDRHGISVPRQDVVEQVHCESGSPHDPRSRFLLGWILVHAHEGRIEGDQECDEEYQVRCAGAIEALPDSDGDQADDEDRRLPLAWPVEAAPEKSQHEGDDGCERPHDVLERMCEAGDLSKGEQVESRHERPNAPAHDVGLGGTLLGLHVVENVPDTMQQRRQNPEDPRKLFHCRLLFGVSAHPAEGLENER